MRASIYSVMALAAAAAPSAAQGRLEVTPFVGVYVPAAHVIDISAFCPGGPCGEVLKQQVAPLFGARVTAWVRERLALDLSLTYSRTGVIRHGLLAEIPTGVIVGPTATDTSGTANITTGSARVLRSEEHTSELQSRLHLVCRLLLEKKKKKKKYKMKYINQIMYVNQVNDHNAVYNDT